MAEEELKPLELKGADGKQITEWATLLASDGKLVDEITLPPAISLPQVVVYVRRVFAREEGTLIYREVSAYFMPYFFRERK